MLATGLHLRSWALHKIVAIEEKDMKTTRRITKRKAKNTGGKVKRFMKKVVAAAKHDERVVEEAIRHELEEAGDAIARWS